MGWKSDFEKNIKSILFALLMPIVFELAGAALYFLVFPEDFDVTGAFLRETDPSAFEELEKSGGSYVEYAVKEIFYSLNLFYIAYATFWGLCEEIGWRGFLYPELKKYVGRTKGVLLGGVIHGVWHFPLMLLIGLEYGMYYIGAPFLRLFTFCIFTVSTGIISDYLYRKSHSIWLPAIFHGAVNSTFNPYIIRGTEHLERSIFGPANVGLISVVPIVIAAVYILCTENRREC